MEQFLCWLAKKYHIIFILSIAIYLLGAFLVPLFFYVDIEIPANILNAFYRKTCHQFAYRSWFLFGKQPFYPIAAAGMHGFITYEESTGFMREDMLNARELIGDEAMGYKVALCQRDIAIFGALLLSGLLFALSQKRWEPLSLLLWICIGILPITVDGVSQLLGNSGFHFLSFFPVRESNPIMRTLTGTLFGFTTGAYLLPRLEVSFTILRENYRCKEN